jgi:hypothetical protein
MYMPAWGRFMQTDPVGYTAGSKLYAYVGNDPLNLIDPAGTDKSPATGSNFCMIFCSASARSPLGNLGDTSGTGPNDRHQIGVDASIADYQARGYDMVAAAPIAVKVPGFETPRVYDFVVRDPIANTLIGVEVKTTLYDTIRLNSSQVAKDAVVMTTGGIAPSLGLNISGVGYQTYCFGCDPIDLRFRALRDT